LIDKWKGVEVGTLGKMILKWGEEGVNEGIKRSKKGRKRP